MTAVSRMQKHGSNGFHANILSALLKEVLVPVYGSDVWGASSMAPRGVLGDAPMAGGLVEFEAPFERATERTPLCFEKVVFPTFLKATAYVGGEPVARKFQKSLSLTMGVNPRIATNRVRVLWVKRNPLKTNGRRSFTERSTEAMRALLNRQDFEIREVDFDGMPFPNQFLEVQEADVIFSIHGAGLTNPATFGRHKSVILELMPYRVYHPMYYSKAYGAGITYMFHQCRQGEHQEHDRKFMELSDKVCEKSRECKHWFMHTRRVELEAADVRDLESMLGIAKSVVVDARVDVRMAGVILNSKYPQLCSAGKMIPDCRHSVLRSALDGKLVDCILSQDCK